MTMPPMRHHGYLAFSLRTFFVLLTVLGIWLGVIANRAREQREAVNAIGEFGGGVRYDWEYGPHGEPSGPVWLRRLIGDDFFEEVRLVTFDGVPPDENLDILASIPYLRRLHGLKTIIVPAATSKSVLHELEIALPECEVYWPEV